MHRALIIIFLLSFSFNCYAEQVYLWVKKSDDSGYSQGDVIAITPATPQYEPTPSELQNVYVIKADLTQDEQANLMQENTEESLVDTQGEKVPETIILNERKNKLDVKTMAIQNPKQSFTKNEIISKTISKPSIAVVDTK